MVPFFGSLAQLLALVQKAIIISMLKATVPRIGVAFLRTVSIRWESE